MKREMLLDALTDIQGEYIDEAGRLLMEGGANRGRARTWRLVLIAAAIASLLTATAFAAGLFGLESHINDTGHITLNGISGSPEARAADEWYKFRVEYIKARFDAGLPVGDEDRAWTGESAALAAAERCYDALERPMAEKLVSIAEEYGLALHEWSSSALTAEDFYDAAGLGEGLILTEKLTRGAGTIYDDGAFTCVLNAEGDMGLGARALLSRYKPGTMMAWTPAISGTEDYDEWEYTNKSGQRLCLAVCRIGDGRRAEGIYVEDDAAWLDGESMGCIFYAENDWQISLAASFPHAADKKALERLADGVDFSQCGGSAARVTYYREYKAHRLSAPQGITWGQFLATNEARALGEFKSWYSESYGDWSEAQQHQFTPFDIYQAVPGYMDEATGEARDRICAQYGLTPPEYMERYIGGRVYAAPYYQNGEEQENAAISDASAKTEEEKLARIGQAEFTNADISIQWSYDTGAFCADGRYPASFALDYIPKGTLYISTGALSFYFREDAPSWSYLTKNGDEVCIALGYWGYGYILYESAEAYTLVATNGFVATAIDGGDGTDTAAYRLESLADSIEFSRLK